MLLRGLSFAALLAIIWCLHVGFGLSPAFVVLLFGRRAVFLKRKTNELWALWFVINTGEYLGFCCACCCLLRLDTTCLSGISLTINADIAG